MKTLYINEYQLKVKNLSWKSLKKIIIFLFMLVSSVCSCQEEIVILADENEPQIQFGVNQLIDILKAKQYQVNYQSDISMKSVPETMAFIIANDSNALIHRLFRKEGIDIVDSLTEESFQIVITKKQKKNIYWAIGKGNTGTMYAALELAEQIRLFGLAGIEEGIQQPHIKYRGLKLNLPLDARTPGYSDSGDAFQKNMLEMWGMDFWEHYLDQMAINRYNVLSLWAPHPFPSLVKVPEYPDVALDDVKRSTFDFKNYGDNKGGVGMGQKEIMDNLVTIKKISIDDKIAHWQKVMKYAADRGIKIYLFTWNIFVWGTDNKYGITDKIDNETTADYIRKSVYHTFKTYPLLAGIGVTAGENMKGIIPSMKEEWVWNTYGKAMNDVKNEEPNRELRFIHRYWQSNIPDITSHFTNLDKEIPFDLSYKYSKARLYSYTNPGFCQKVLEDAPRDQMFWWNLRNDDIFNFRWGNPDYVREFIQNIPEPEYTRGFYMGSDGYLWAREHTSLHPSVPRQWETDKHWYRFLLWGRLAYNPSLSTRYFEKLLENKFPGVDAAMLYEVWARVSQIIPAVNREHWRDWDFHWAVEYCDSRNKGFHSINENWKPGALDVANEIKGYANFALSNIQSLRLTNDNELVQTLGDIEAMAYLGKYYSEKFMAAHFLQIDTALAVMHLNEAATHWRNYAAVAGSQYGPQVLSKIHYVDWRELYEYVLKDISLLNGNASFTETPELVGGQIFEAEDALLVNAKIEHTLKSYTGNGYIELLDSSKVMSVEFGINAQEKGDVLVDIRYALAENKEIPLNYLLNGIQAGVLKAWITSPGSAWAWDRIYLSLEKGINVLKINTGDSEIRIDHIKVQNIL